MFHMNGEDIALYLVYFVVMLIAAVLLAFLWPVVVIVGCAFAGAKIFEAIGKNTEKN